MLKMSLVIVLSIFLMACGGDEQPPAPTIATVDGYPEEDLSPGEFLSMEQEGYAGKACPNLEIQDRFFKTENLVVFGVPGVLDKELQIVATFSEESLADVASTFNLTIPDLRSYRVNPNNPIMICASYQTLGRSTGRLKDYGVQIRNPNQIEYYMRENNYAIYRHVIEHEFVHYAQYVISGVKLNSWNIPLWFTEGMAEYLTGGVIATSSSSNPHRNVIQEEGEIYFEWYDEAAMVVKYISETLGNGKESMLQFLLNMRTYYKKPDGYSTYQEIFALTFVDYDGSPLDYNRLVSEYWERFP